MRYKAAHLTQIIAESVIGNTHIHRQLPNQDSHTVYVNEDNVHEWFVAIADGHGSKIHARSDVGSNLAVKASMLIVKEFLEGAKADNEAAKQLSLNELKEVLVHKILQKWKLLVDEHYALNSDDLNTDTGNEDVPIYVLYGSTLAFAFTYQSDIILASIGDSDGFWRSASGLTRNLSLLGERDEGVGEETYSLCQKSAASYFNLNAIPIASGGTIILATDGVKKSLSNSDTINQLLDYYHRQCILAPDEVSTDLKDQLAELTTHGSGDDCTAIIIHLGGDGSEISAAPSPIEEVTKAKVSEINMDTKLTEECATDGKKKVSWAQPWIGIAAISTLCLMSVLIADQTKLDLRKIQTHLSATHLKWKARLETCVRPTERQATGGKNSPKFPLKTSSKMGR